MAIAIRGVRLWTGDGDLPDAQTRTLLLEDGRIAGIADADVSCAGHRSFDWPGAFAMPGLIDAHVHLWLDPALASPDAQAEVEARVRSAAMEERARAMLRAGITTARDLGGPDGSELRLRDRILAGELSGPRLLCAAQPLTTPGGHCWFWGGEAEGRAEIRATVARQVEAGCDWIKVMATGGLFTRGSSPGAAQYSAAQLAEVVSRARSHGRPVAAHAHGTRGIHNAALAGVDTVEHCSFVGSGGGFGSDPAPDVIESLARAGVRVSTTINSGWRRYEQGDGARAPTRARMRLALQRLRAAGVPLLASTDAGIPGVAHDDLPRALPVFARFAGLTAAEALRSATSLSADALGLGGVCGRLAPGLAADVLVLDRDPTRDLSGLARPLAVFARGALAPS